jgi:hypothetical protein
MRPPFSLRSKGGREGFFWGERVLKKKFLIFSSKHARPDRFFQKH